MRSHIRHAAALICLLMLLSLGVSPVATAYDGDEFPPGGGGYFFMPVPSEPPGTPFILPEFEQPEYGERWFRYFWPDAAEDPDVPGRIIFGKDNEEAPDAAQEPEDAKEAQPPSPPDDAQAPPEEAEAPISPDDAPPDADEPEDAGEADAPPSDGLLPPPDSIWAYLKTLPTLPGDRFDAVPLPLPGEPFELYPLPMGR